MTMVTRRNYTSLLAKIYITSFTGAPVKCPKMQQSLLVDILRHFTPFYGHFTARYGALVKWEGAFYGLQQPL